MTSHTASVSNVLQKKRKLEDERDVLIRKLDDLDAEITKTQAEYGELCNRNTPILAFPVEVTCLIFREAYATETTHKSEHSNQEICELTEVAMTHVCRQWRSVAISLPILWTSFYYSGQFASAATLDRFEVYLERSKTKLLELWFEFRGSDSRGDALHRAALQKAIAHVNRWRLFTIFSCSETHSQHSFTTDALHLLKSLHAPNLEHFALYPDFPYETVLQSTKFIQQSLQPDIFTEGAPKLRSVWMDTSTPVFYLPPLANVTTLRIEFGSQSVDMFISISSLRALLAIPTLENLSLSEAICNAATALHPEPIHMNRLRHLRFSNDLLCNILPDIRAPLLETLIAHNSWISPEHYTDLGRPEEPYTFPSLKNLTFVDVACGDRAAMWYFACMTRNASLITIAQMDFEDAILHSIDDLPEKEEDFWPKLRTLTCDVNVRYTEDIAVLQMIARCWSRYNRPLTIKMPRMQVMQWKELAPPQATYESVSELCTVEELAANDLRDQGPWPPGEQDTLDHRLDYGDSDPFQSSMQGFAFHLNYVTA